MQPKAPWDLRSLGATNRYVTCVTPNASIGPWQQSNTGYELARSALGNEKTNAPKPSHEEPRRAEQGHFLPGECPGLAQQTQTDGSDKPGVVKTPRS